MPLSLTGLVTGANRLIAGHSRGQVEGEELRERRAERRRAAERQALQDSLEQQYRTAQIGHLGALQRRAEQPEVRNIDPLSPAGIAAQIAAARGVGQTGFTRSGNRQTTPRRAQAAEFTREDIDAEQARDPAPTDRFGRPVSAAVLRGRAIARLRRQREQGRRQPPPAAAPSQGLSPDNPFMARP